MSPVAAIGAAGLVACVVMYGIGVWTGRNFDGALVEVKPMVKCDLQQLYQEAYAACRAKGGNLSDLGEVLDDQPDPLVCIGGVTRHVVPLAELSH